MISPTKINNPLILGRIGSAHGVKGALKIHSETHPKEHIFSYQPWQIKIRNQWVSLKTKFTQQHGHTLIACFEGYEDRDLARTLTGAEIATDPSRLPALPEGEFYWNDLIDLDVITLDGTSLGKVISLMETGSNDVLIVKQDSKERLIPYIRNQYVKEINLTKKHIIVDWDPDF